MAPEIVFRIGEMKESSEHHESQAKEDCWRPSRIPTAQNLRWAIRSFAVGAATVSNLAIDGYQGAVIARQSRAEQHSSYQVPSSVSRPLFDRFSSSREPKQSVSMLQEVLRTGITSEQQQHSLPAFIRDPSDVQLVVACLVCSIAMNGFYHIHKGDRYQHIILVCGTLSALAVGLVLKQDPQYVITGLGRWAVMVSLLLSAAFHRLLRDCGEGARMTLP